jgi:hypothetical protein
VVAFVFSDRVKGIARKLSPVGFNIVSACRARINAKRTASLGYYRKLARDVVDIRVRNEAEAEISEIVENSSAAESRRERRTPSSSIFSRLHSAREF